MQLMKKPTSLLLVLLAFSLLVPGASAQEQRGYINQLPAKDASPDEWREYHRQQMAIAKAAGVEDEKYGIHNGNRVETIFYNYGTVSAPQSVLDVIWPKGSGRGYAFEFGVIAGAEVMDINGARKQILSEHMADGGDRSPGGVPWGWQPLPGYANPDQQLLAMSDCEDNDGPDGIPNSGDDDGIPDCYPQTPHYQEWGLDPLNNPFYDAPNNRYVWPGEYGFNVLTADQESYYIMNDLSNQEFKYYPFVREGYALETASVATGTSGDSLLTLTDPNATFLSNDFNIGTNPTSDVVRLNDNEANPPKRRYYYIDSVQDDNTLILRTISNSPQSIEGDWDPINYTIRDGNKRGLGLEVEARGYQWSHTLAQDCIFFIYDFQNISDDTLGNVYFAMYGDPHVGGKNDYSDDDSDYDVLIDMVYSWDHDMTGDGGFRPGYFGYTFLESPGDPDNGVDDDQDGLVDESMQDGVDNDGDWDTFSDYNNNGIWDEDEPLNDDLGEDGIGPDNLSYISPDQGEGDGMPTPGEPDFDETDLDEADQIGLTSFVSMIYGNRITPGQDAAFWNRMTQGIIESDIAQTTDNIFIYSSGPITMAPDQRRRFSISLLMGNDEDDLFRSANTVQEIYNAGYQFVKAPNKPSVTAVEGDGRVTLYWDSRAERSRDPIYGQDFEGYAIYRATDIGFNEVFDITDSQGNPKLWNPLVRYDLDNDIAGPHPIEQVNGIHYYMGDNTGLSHTFTDTSVMNGQRYFYAVVAYDSGSVENNISPSETTKNIQVALNGAITTDVNTVMVTPRASSAGYQPPDINETQDDRYEGPGTGKISARIVDPSKVKDGRTYQVRFIDTASDGVDNDGDWTPFSDDNGNGTWDPGEDLNDDTGIDGLVPGDTLPPYPGPDEDGTQGNGEPDPGEPNFEYLDLDEMDKTTVSYSLYDITDSANENQVLRNSTLLNGQDANPVIDGLLLQVTNDTLDAAPSRSKWVTGDTYLKTTIQEYPDGPSFKYPADYHILIRQDGYTTDFFNQDANFIVWNATDDDMNDNGQYDEGEPLTNFALFDSDGDRRLTAGDKVLLVENETPQSFLPTWQIVYRSPAAIISDIGKDGNDRLWFSTAKGLTEYFDGTWREISVGGPVQTVYIDQQNYKWLGQSDGLKRYRFGNLRTIDEFVGIRVNEIRADEMNRIWFATGTAGVYSYDGEYTHFPADTVNGTTGPINSDTRALAFDEAGNVFVGTADGLCYYDGATWSEIDVSNLNSKIIESLFVDVNGTLWIGTLNQLASFQFGSGAAVEIDGPRIRDITAGPDGELWVAANDGIHIRQPDGTWTHRTQQSNQAAPSTNDISALAFIDDIMYIGTYSGLDFYANGTESWETYNPQIGDTYKLTTDKQFSHLDTYTFSTDSQFVDSEEANNDLDKVAVVPNPYVATATWEPKQNLLAGRGERRIWFIHLPQQGTIRIFTLTGELVKKIEFNNDQRDGSVSWDLLNDDRLEIAYGVYLYQVDSPYGTSHGKFAIIK